MSKVKIDKRICVYCGKPLNYRIENGEEPLTFRNEVYHCWDWFDCKDASKYLDENLDRKNKINAVRKFRNMK